MGDGDRESMSRIMTKGPLYVSEGHGSAVPNSIGDRIKLNVGGTIFETSRGTLLGGGAGNSMLSRMFDPSLPMSPARLDGNGAYFIDRDPKYFAPILNYLRSGKLIVDPGLNAKGVLEEVSFFGMDGITIEREDNDTSVLTQLTDRLSKLEMLMDSVQRVSAESLRLQKIQLRIEALDQLSQSADYNRRGPLQSICTTALRDLDK